MTMPHDEKNAKTSESGYLKGRGSQFNPANPFLEKSYVTEEIEGLDEEFFSNEKTRYFMEYPKNVVNRVQSPDVGADYSINPYQGCEHGCIYCYARNTHTYWGFSAGLDFEQKIIVKTEAPQLLEKKLSSKNWQPMPIMVSGNTDCYQPIERELGITRKMLEIFLRHHHPLGLITKNGLITRDLDLLSELAKLRLVRVMISITTLKESLRLKMEPRTASARKRLQTMEKLANAGVPVGVMTAPIIPGLNSDEIPSIIKAVANHGGVTAGYTIVRLNGQIGEIFTDWIHKTFPDRAEKVLNQIAEVHGGNLNDSQFGRRMRGDGNIANSIRQLFKSSVKQYLSGRQVPEYDLTAFIRNPNDRQMKLF